MFPVASSALLAASSLYFEPLWFLAFFGFLPLFLKTSLRERLLFGLFFSAAVAFPLFKAFLLVSPSFLWAVLLFSATVVFLTVYQFGLSHLLSRLGLFFPLAYALVELLRLFFPFGGFPIGVVGYAPVDAPFLRHSVGLLTPYGATLLVLTFNYLLAVGIKEKSFRPPLAGLAFLAAVSAVGFLRQASGPPAGVRVALVQPFWDQRDKLENPNSLLPYKVYLTELALKRAKVVFLPEGFLEPSDRPGEFFKAFAEGTLLVGANRLVYDFERGEFFARNAVFFAEGGRLAGVYLKRKLVPFGEFLPKDLSFLSAAVPYLGGADYRPGRSSAVFELKGIKLQPLICNEAFYPFLVERRAEAVAVFANDAWFYPPFSVYHLKAVKALALLWKKPVLFVNSDGLSGAVRPDGRYEGSPLSRVQVLLL
ncbi:MAG: apolipoprotein N-acyltransferase [Aquificae bacterium]|nr:apolipoprotein N-acyltransferase [Aquificota bacterium]